MKSKIIRSSTLPGLQEKINEFISGVEVDSVSAVSADGKSYFVVVLYHHKETITSPR